MCLLRLQRPVRVPGIEDSPEMGQMFLACVSGRFFLEQWSSRPGHLSRYSSLPLACTWGHEAANRDLRVLLVYHFRPTRSTSAFGFSGPTWQDSLPISCPRDLLASQLRDQHFLLWMGAQRWRLGAEEHGKKEHVGKTAESLSSQASGCPMIPGKRTLYGADIIEEKECTNRLKHLRSIIITWLVELVY